MILFDIVIVTVSNVPLGVMYVYLISKAIGSRITLLENMIFLLTQLLSATQVFGSFYFYLIISSAFRKNVKNMLCSIACFWKPRAMRQVEPTNRAIGPTMIEVKSRNTAV